MRPFTNRICLKLTLLRSPTLKHGTLSQVEPEEAKGVALGDQRTEICVIAPDLVQALAKELVALQHVSARLHERSCFFARLSASCFSSCSCLCLLERIFKHQLSELMFDGDCRRKF